MVFLHNTIRKFTTMACSKDIFMEIPSSPDPSWVVNYLEQGNFSTAHVQLLREEGVSSDKILASILNLAPKTFVSYTKDIATTKLDTKEHILILLALIKHGTEVFGTPKNFGKWLEEKNVYLDYRSPLDYLQTVSGIRMIDDRLTAMEFGDNV